MAIGPLPPDPLYDASLNRIARQRDATVATLRDERTQGLGGYGYIEGPNGSLRFDANNPMSKAALLKRLHDTQRRSVGQQMGSGGQLYAGAYQNAQDLSNRNQLQAQDSLQKSLTSFLASNTARRTAAQTDYQTGAQVLGAERVGRIDTNPLYEPTAEEPAAAALPKRARGAPGGPPQKPSQRKAMTKALRNTRIGGKPVSYQQWQRGDLLKALLAKPKPKKKHR
jgi:hypothetical protein